MEILQKIELLNRCLTIEAINNSDENRELIVETIDQITSSLLQDYNSQKDYVAELLDVYEKHNIKCVAYLMYVLDKLYLRFDTLHVLLYDDSYIKNNHDFDEHDKIFDAIFLQSPVEKKAVLRFSDDITVTLPEDQAQSFVWMVNEFLNILSGKVQMASEDLIDIAINLSFARYVLKQAGKLEIFYLFAGTLVDILYRHGQFQIARNTAEEIITCGYKDNKTEFGYFVAFKVYLNTSSITAALHYAICSIQATLDKGYIYDKSYRMWIWELIKFYRNSKLLRKAIETFENRPKKIVFKGFEKNALHNSYFTCLIGQFSPIAPSLVIDYLNANREDLITATENQIIPWLVILYNIIYNYDDTYSGYEECIVYAGLFERIVPSEHIKRNKDILFGDLQSLKVHLKDALIDLSSTNFEIDFTTDNKLGRLIANQVIKKSFSEEDVDGYLLSMIIISDYSFVFKKKPYPEFSIVGIERKPFEQSFFTTAEVIDFLVRTENSTFLWLGSDGQVAYPLYFNMGTFLFCSSSTYGINRVNTWFHENLSKMPFDDQREDRSGANCQKNLKDYEDESLELIKELEFSRINIPDSKKLLVVKDYELGVFPHNLLLNYSHEFLYILNPIMNIMSFDWLMSKLSSARKARQFISKSIWIPLDSQDFALNWLFSFLNETLVDNKFEISSSLLPEEPLHANLNIVAAHGNNEINTFPAFFAANDKEKISIVNLQRVIGPGEILILFVCHSGSMKSDVLKNRISTLIKEYLKSGYEVVIAPFWALNIEIPKIWLPAFLESLDQGNEIIIAVHAANMKVRSVFPTPKAYACLHAYGNPFFRLHRC